MRSPTFSRDAERSVLGAILSGGSYGCGARIFERVRATGLVAGDFALETHGRLFALLVLQAERGDDLDPLSVAAAIHEHATSMLAFPDIVDVDQLASRLWGISHEVTCFGSVEHHCAIVRRLSRERSQEEAA